MVTCFERSEVLRMSTDAEDITYFPSREDHCNKDHFATPKTNLKKTEIC